MADPTPNRRRLLRQVAPGYSVMSWRRVNGTSPNHTAKQVREQRVIEISRLLRGNPRLTPEAVMKRYQQHKIKLSTAATYIREAKRLGQGGS